MLTFFKNIKSVCSKLEILWVKTALCLPQGSQGIPGSAQQNVWDNPDSSHATGFQIFVANQSENVFQVWCSQSSRKRSVGHLGAAVQ